jgi:hypothetical protein
VTHCDSSPLHPPAAATFRTTNNGDAVETPLCLDCLPYRIQVALDAGEGFTVTSPVPPVALPPYPAHLMSDL